MKRYTCNSVDNLFRSFNSVWKNEGPFGWKIGIEIESRDIEDGRTFHHYQDIRLIRVKSFAIGLYKKPPLSISIENIPKIGVKRHKVSRDTPD